jgi:PAS domain S-box-containing protein
LSVGLLTYIGSRTYKQVQELRESADMVAHTLRIEAEINRLFSQYAMMQSSIFENKLRQNTDTARLVTIQKDSAAAIMDRLRLLTSDNEVQQQNLRRAASIQEEFYKALHLFNAYQLPLTSTENTKNVALDSVATRMDMLENLKTEMLQSEETLLRKRQLAYKQSRYFTPLMTLLLGMFALSVFLFSFLRINRERKLTQQSSAFLQNILKSSPNVVSHFEPVENEKNDIVDFKFLFTSEQIKDVTGDLQNNVIGTKLKESFPMAAENGLLDDMKRCLQTGEPQTHEAEYEFDGKKIWLTNTINKLGNGVTNTAHDITLQKQTEEKLRTLNERLSKQNLLLLDSKAFLNNIFKSTSNVVMNLASIRDDKKRIVDFKILFMNDAINMVTGNLPEEIKNKKASVIFPTIFTSGVFENLVTCIEEDKKETYETSYEKEGNVLWFQATAIKLNDGVTITSTDITEDKRRAALQLRLNEELQIQNSILMDAEKMAKVGSYSADIENELFEFSPNLYSLLEYEPDEFIPTFDNYRKLIHPDDEAEYIEQSKAVREGVGPDGFVYRVKTKTNKVKWFKAYGHFEQRQKQKILVGVIQDVTQEIKAAEGLRTKNQELKRSNAELESFNRVASHDLQEPMRKIQMFISRISENDLSKLSNKGRTYFEKIDNSANRMQTLIKYLLAYSRINRTKKDFVPVDLNETMNKVLEDLEERITESKIEIAVDKLPTVKAIPFQMEQLLNNLISNAIKYRIPNNDSKVVIDCKKLPKAKIPNEFVYKRKGYFRLTVMDNGIGFDQENSEKIFGLFERLHQKDEYSGTGIGLAICKKIAQNHKGYIVAESEAGKGASFCVYLPA